MHPAVRFACLGLILVCLGILGARLLSEGGSHHERKDWNVPWTLRCEDCSHTFKMSKVDFAGRAKDMADFTPDKRDFWHCPACKAAWRAKLVFEPSTNRPAVLDPGTLLEPSP